MQRIKVEYAKEYCSKTLTIGMHTSHKCYYNINIIKWTYRVRKRQVEKSYIGNPETMIKDNSKNQEARISKHRLEFNQDT